MRHGPAVSLMLDSNRGEMDRAEWELQGRWLRGRLEAADADPSVRLVALVTHHPPLTGMSSLSEVEVKADFYDVAAAFPKFRVFFSGHHHAYQHLTEGGRHAFVTGGGGAALFFHKRSRLQEGVTLVRAERAHHFLYCTLRDDALRVEMHALGEDGTWSVDDSVEVPFAPGK